MDETWDAHPSVKKAILANVPSMYHTAVGSQKTGQMIDEVFIFIFLRLKKSKETDCKMDFSF